MMADGVDATPRSVAVLLGGMRCGTRAFGRYLSQHPAICPHKKLHDPHFFSSDENWANGVGSYLDGFTGYDPSRHAYGFESSTHYAKFPYVKHVPSRMAASGLDFKLMMAARDPIARIDSHMKHNAGKGYFDANDATTRAKFLRMAADYSAYAMQIAQYDAHFPPDRLFAFTQERLAADPAGVMREVCAFLNIEQRFAFDVIPRIETKTTQPTDDIALTDEEVTALRDRLRPEAETFAMRFGLDITCWHKLWGDEPRPAPLPASQRRSLRRRFAVRRLPDRHAMVTIDTEALPSRAATAHVDRLIWGRHDAGTAGLEEICDIADGQHTRLTWFVDMVEEELYPGEITAVARRLCERDQDVQLHTHPELLPGSFWTDRELPTTKMPDQFGPQKAAWVIGEYSRKLEAITGRKTLGFRAGSYRYNAQTIRALAVHGIPLSFNNQSKQARADRNFHSELTNDPFLWGNGVIELPITSNGHPEKAKTFVFPRAADGSYDVEHAITQIAKTPETPFCMLIMHSWALLHADADRMFVYKDDSRLAEFEKLLSRLRRDYDMIDSAEALDLVRRGKITPTHTVDLPN